MCNTCLAPPAAFNQPISGAGTRGQVIGLMSRMFQSAAAFNQPIGSWNTGQVSLMSQMFHGAAAFNQPIVNWDTSQVAT